MHGSGGVRRESGVVAESVVLLFGFLAHRTELLLDLALVADVLVAEHLLDLAEEGLADFAFARSRRQSRQTEEKQFHFLKKRKSEINEELHQIIQIIVACFKNYM